MKHKCFHPDCDKLIPAGEFACTYHWLRLPIGIRSRLTKTYREYKAKRSMYHLGALRNAQAAAIEFVKSRKHPV